MDEERILIQSIKHVNTEWKLNELLSELGILTIIDLYYKPRKQVDESLALIEQGIKQLRNLFEQSKKPTGEGE